MNLACTGSDSDRHDHPLPIALGFRDINRHAFHVERGHPRCWWGILIGHRAIGMVFLKSSVMA